MNLALELVTGPEWEPITLAQAKRHLRMFDSDTSEDDDITALIEGARQFVENYTGRVLVDQTWRLTVEPDDTVTEIYLRKSPVLAIVSMVSVDTAGDETTIDSTTYELREGASKYPRVVPIGSANWTSADVLKITFRAGYADTTGSPQDAAAEVPATYRSAMKLWIEANYDRGAEMQDLMAAAQNLIEHDRCTIPLA